MTNPPTQVQVFQATETHDVHTLHFQITRMQDSLFAWVGESSPSSQQSHDDIPDPSSSSNQSAPTGKLDGLSVAMPTRYDRSAVSTVLLPQSADDPNERIAKRLATKHGIQVFVAMEVNSTGGESDVVLRLAERRLAALIKDVLAPPTTSAVDRVTKGVEEISLVPDH
ncbi:hypothetical protein PhCBS80983_g01272 [Powellomyces hirtus]|uniref:Proteasome assembly chaperone 3 n=1 Tax=Powellomyces hirtus TaxID=109895 RepID=A0A507EAT7_9FUNG|nr:hypothetical protein PhCBS80983_g01272 [Powellomyces hirtus]